MIAGHDGAERDAALDEAARRIASLVLRARTLVEVLRHAPAEGGLRGEVVRLAGAASGLADRRGWTAAAAVAGELVRMLAATRRGPPPCGPLRRTLKRLDALVHERISPAS